MVPGYRLDLGKLGERLHPILDEVFDFYGLREPPWGCMVPRKGARKEDIAF